MMDDLIMEERRPILAQSHFYWSECSVCYKPSTKSNPLKKCTRCGACSMCPQLYVSIALCVQGSMWPISCCIDPLCPGFYGSRVLCVLGSMWPEMNKLTLCVMGPMWLRLYVSKALCGRSLHYIAKLSPSFSLSWTEMIYILTFPQPPTHPGKYQNGPI